MSLEDIPSYFADFTGINEGTAQVILSSIIIFTFLCPYLILARKEASPMISLILVFLAECLLVGIGWLPFWILIMSALMCAFAVAFLGSKITGE
jgi:hypothetical protein